jgi:hypothetical protein
MNKMVDMEKLEAQEPYIASFWELRQGIGILGISLPFILAIFEWLLFQKSIQDSISYYYYTGMRDVLVGVLCATGVFLWVYKGYDHADEYACKIAAVSAVGIALFPTPSDQAYKGFSMHFIFAAVFFLTLTFISWVLFTKTSAPKSKRAKKGKLPGRKARRNMIYRVCAAVMFACILLIGVSGMAALPFKMYSQTFWLETIALIAFGFSWITKGQLILKDEAKKLKKG